MPFSPAVKTAIFTRCNRLCCLCRKQCGINIEAAHIVDEAAGGSNDADNCIPLCFDCHQEIGSYNDNHPRGNRFRADELRTRRDRVYAQVADARVDPPQPVNLYDRKLSLGWSNVLPDELKDLISLELTTPPPVSRNIARSGDGQFWLVHWDCVQCQYKWDKITDEYAAEALQPVARCRNMTDWRDLLKK